MKFLKMFYAMVLMVSMSLTVVAYNGSKIEKQDNYCYSQDTSPDDSNYATYDFGTTNYFLSNSFAYSEYKKQLSGRIYFLSPKINTKYHCDWILNKNKIC